MIRAAAVAGAAILLPQAAAAQALAPTDVDLPARIERLSVRVTLEADGTNTRVIEARVSLRNAAGVAAFGTLALPYVADFGEVRYEEIAIQKPDGARVEVRDPPIEDINPYGMDAGSLPADYRVRKATIPGLAAGDVLSYRVVVRQRPLYPGAVFDEFTFVTGPVAAEQVYELDTPRTLALSTHRRPGLPAEWEDAPSPPGRQVRRLALHAPLPEADPSLSRVEALERAAEPDVIVTTFRSWKDVGAWWWDLAKESFVPDAAVRAEAARLTAGKADPRARAEALHAFVATQVRYVNVGFGSGRLKPRPASEVLANRYAECKGKHALFAALGAAVGLDIAPVLVHSARSGLHDDAPSPSQFDHLISVVRLGADPAQWLWVDTTADTALAGQLNLVLRDKAALLVDASGGRVVRTPAHSAVPARSSIDVSGTMDATGPIRVRVRWTLRDDVEPVMRSMLRAVPRDKLPDMGKAMLKDWWPKAKVSDVSTSDPVDLAQPFRIELAAEHVMGASVFAKDWTLWIPLPALGLPKAGDAETAATLDDYEELAQHARIEMPEGMKARAPLSITLDRPFASFRSAYVVEGRSLVIDRVLKIRRRRIAAAEKADYEAFRAAVETDRGQEFPIEAFSGGAVVEAADTADALNKAGTAALDAGDYVKAEALLRQATVKDPAHKWAWNNLGRALRALKRPQEALAAFDRQIAINPFDVYAHGNRGATLLFDLERLQEGEAALLRQIEVAPFDVFAYVDLARLRSRQKRFGDAADLLERAVAAKNAEPEHWLRLAFARLRAGRSDAAAAVARYRAGKRETLDDVSAARALALAGDLPAAARFVDEILPALRSHVSEGASAPTGSAGDFPHEALFIAEAWRIKGAAALADDDAAKGDRYLTAAVGLAALPEAAVALGRLREAQGRTAEAIDLFQQGMVFPGWVGDPARAELARVVKDPARRAELTSAAGQALGRAQVQKFEGPASAGTLEVKVWMVSDEEGRILDVGARDTADAARVGPFRETLMRLTLPGKAPEPGPFKVVRSGTVACFKGAGCHLGLDVLGDEVGMTLEY